MNIIFLIFCSILVVELFIKYKFVAKSKLFIDYLYEIKKNIFSRKIPDKTKEIMIRKYLLKLSSKILGILFLLIWILSPFLLLVILDYYFKFQFLEVLLSYKGIIVSIFFPLLYGMIRNYVFK